MDARGEGRTSASKWQVRSIPTFRVGAGVDASAGASANARLEGARGCPVFPLKILTYVGLLEVTAYCSVLPFVTHRTTC